MIEHESLAQECAQVSAYSAEQWLPACEALMVDAGLSRESMLDIAASGFSPRFAEHLARIVKKR